MRRPPRKRSRELAPVVALIKRGDLSHYRFLAVAGDEATLRALVLLLADDLEEALEAIGPEITDGVEGG